MTSVCQRKYSWPELLGVPGEEAVKVIEKESPGVVAIIVLPGQPIILNINCGRVWVFVDDDGIVTKVPVVG